MSQTQRTRWIELWDPSRYLPDVSMPILFINGTNDFAYPLDSYMRSFDAVPGNKQLCITVNMPHGHPQGWAPQEISLFVDQHLKNGKALPTVDQTEFQDNELLISVSSSTPLAKAELHYTTQTTAINKREWLTCDAEIVDNQISVAAPPADSTAWFITVEDERGATISSRIHFESDSP